MPATRDPGPVPHGKAGDHDIGVAGGMLQTSFAAPRKKYLEAPPGRPTPYLPGKVVSSPVEPHPIPWNVNSGVELVLSLYWQRTLTGFSHQAINVLCHNAIQPDTAIEEVDDQGIRHLLLNSESWAESCQKASQRVAALVDTSGNQLSPSLMEIVETLA